MNNSEAFVILEWNGLDWINLVVDEEDGTTKIFSDETKAKNWGNKNCSFNYKIIKIY